MLKNETVEEFIARGGQVVKCKTYGYRKHSSIPGLYKGQQATTKKKHGVDAQELLDAAIGTEHEAEAITFLESQGFEVS